jgi:hypothetical protein
MQYTIESRQLTNGYSQRPSFDPGLMQIEAVSADDAIGQFVRRSDSELVSLHSPARSQESIAIVKKNDSVYLVRVYAA